MERVVLITGATGGLGRIAARAFADDGARLALTGTDEARLRGLATDLGLGDDRWMPVVVDLRDRDAAQTALRATEEAIGRIDVVLHLVSPSCLRETSSTCSTSTCGPRFMSHRRPCPGWSSAAGDASSQ